jgi:glycosyltransferase involved in cell wall biosynthesis
MFRSSGPWQQPPRNVPGRPSVTAAPPITIGMPVYNGERYLAEAIESILGQTFVDFVFVISDNASTDATADIARSYAAGDARVRYLRQAENRGSVWNFNHVFAECHSPCFKWAACDDLLAPTCVERSHEALTQAPRGEVVLVAPETRWIGPDGEFLREGNDRMGVSQETPHARLGYVVRNVVWGNTQFGLIVSDALRQTRGLGSYSSSDWVLLSELALAGKFLVVPEPLFFRRDHPEMSRRASSTPLELAQWHAPGNVKPEQELRRVFKELLAAIKHAPLSPGEKALCYEVMVTAWMRRHTLRPPWLRSLADSHRRRKARGA